MLSVAYNPFRINVSYYLYREADRKGTVVCRRPAADYCVVSFFNYEKGVVQLGSVPSNWVRVKK